MKADNMFYVSPEGSKGVLCHPEMSEDYHGLNSINLAPPFTGAFIVPKQTGDVIIEITYKPSRFAPPPIPDKVIFNGVEYVKKIR